MCVQPSAASYRHSDTKHEYRCFEDQTEAEYVRRWEEEVKNRLHAERHAYCGLLFLLYICSSTSLESGRFIFKDGFNAWMGIDSFLGKPRRIHSSDSDRQRQDMKYAVQRGELKLTLLIRSHDCRDYVRVYLHLAFIRRGLSHRDHVHNVATINYGERHRK